ncbi:MAG: TolC family protein [Bacteroidales bacterium]|nr:TolC family protein [Bacteroidales bacterium]
MMKILGRLAILAALFSVPTLVSAQDAAPADTSAAVITLDQALQIALSENETVKIADLEIERTGYAKKGTYASLLPQVDLTGSYMRTLKKQVMYMDVDMSSFFGSSTSTSTSTTDDSSSSSASGIEVGRDNTYTGGLTASMPLVNFQLWESLKVSGKDVELAVEKARSSRLEMVTQVKQAFYGVLFAKEALNVYKSVYENAVENFEQTEKKYNVQKATELDYTRAKTNVASAIPDVYNAESSVILALWQLKAVMGVDLDRNIDVAGSLGDYTETMFRDIHQNDDASLDYNSTMRQLAIQAEELANAVRIQKYAYLPSLAATFSYTMNAMTNDFKFSEYQWTPYSYVGLSLTIPIFSGGKRLNDVRQAKAQKTELDLTIRNTERQLKIAIRQYLNTMETNMKSYNSALETVALAQKAYDISAISYQVGKSTITDLNDAQLALTQAKLAESQAVYNFLVAKSNLEQTIGFDFIEK